jgi:hypothetical protein
VLNINSNTLYFKGYILALSLQTLKNDYKKNQWIPFSLGREIVVKREKTG